MLFEIIFFALYLNYCLFFKNYKSKIFSGILFLIFMVGIKNSLIISFKNFDINIAFLIIYLIIAFVGIMQLKNIKLSNISILLTTIYYFLTKNNILLTNNFNLSIFLLILFFLQFLYKNEYLSQMCFILLIFELINFFVFTNAIGYYSFFSNEFIKQIIFVFFINIIEPYKLVEMCFVGRRKRFYAGN